MGLVDDAPGDPPDDLPEEVVIRLWVAIARLSRALRQAGLANDDMALSQLTTLGNLEGRRALTLGELAAAERVDPSTMNRLVGRLEAAGRVRRVVDETDRRKVQISLTEHGERALATHRIRRSAYLRSLLEGLEPDERAAMVAACAVLEKLAMAPSPAGTPTGL
jgi:DNA-binding MarR family transcriptional regulator